MSRHIVSDVSTHHSVARRGFEPLTSSLKGMRTRKATYERSH